MTIRQTLGRVGTLSDKTLIFAEVMSVYKSFKVENAVEKNESGGAEIATCGIWLTPITPARVE